MSDESTAYCAHLRVIYAPFDCGNGTLMERWRCTACGCEFFPQYRIEALENEVDRLRGRVLTIADCAVALRRSDERTLSALLDAIIDAKRYVRCTQASEQGGGGE